MDNIIFLIVFEALCVFLIAIIVYAARSVCKPKKYPELKPGDVYIYKTHGSNPWNGLTNRIDIDDVKSHTDGKLWVKYRLTAQYSNDFPYTSYFTETIKSFHKRYKKYINYEVNRDNEVNGSGN